MKIKFLGLFFLLVLFSCKNELSTSGGVKIISYNLQNFFDAKDNGAEYDEFLEKSSLWNESKYEVRVEKLFSLLKKDIFSSASVIFFQEVENDNILKLLLEKGLSRRGFSYYGCVNSGTPLSIGFISKIKPVSISSNATQTSRAVLGFECFINNEQVFLYVLHAKSQIGGEAETRKERKELASLLKILTDDKKGANIIILGDFNEEFSYSSDLSYGYVPLGLFEQESIEKAHSIPITGDKSLSNYEVFYSPFLDKTIPLNSDGTYYYDGAWSFLDNALISSSFIDEKGLEFEQFYVIKEKEMVENGIPYRYDIQKGNGISDHFAIALEIGR